jgi:hypothetical protein
MIINNSLLLDRVYIEILYFSRGLADFKTTIYIPKIIHFILR